MLSLEAKETQLVLSLLAVVSVDNVRSCLLTTSQMKQLLLGHMMPKNLKRHGKPLNLTQGKSPLSFGKCNDECIYVPCASG